MPSTIGEYSIQMLSYFVLQAALEQDRNPDAFSDSFGFPRIIVENLDAWFDHVDFHESEDLDDVDTIQEHLVREIKEGSYLKDGKDVFLQKVASFMGSDFEDRAFYQFLKEAVDAA